MPELLTLPTLGLIGPLGPLELIALAVIGLLIFGKRLPEVGKSVGRGIVEFKRGLSGIDDEIDRAAKQPPRIENRQSPTDAQHTEREPEPYSPGHTPNHPA